MTTAVRWGKEAGWVIRSQEKRAEGERRGQKVEVDDVKVTEFVKGRSVEDCEYEGRKGKMICILEAE